MKKNGFSLVELIVVLSIISTLLAIATLKFNDYTRKANIEAQVKMMYADLMTVRAQALFQRRGRSVTVTATQFSVYSSNVVGGAAPVMQKELKYPVLSNVASSIAFDSRGLLVDPSNGGRGICVSSENPAAIDSLVLSVTRIQLGKWDIPGGFTSECKSDYIKTK